MHRISSTRAIYVPTEKGTEYWSYPPYVPGSYCEQRVGKELGLPAEENKFAIVGQYGRFWVRKVNPLPAEQKIGNILPFYEREMPAFMAYLNQREMYYAPSDETKLDRMYFHPDMLHTPWLDRLLEAQRPRAERKMREWLHQWFIDFGQKELLTTLDKLQEVITYTDRKFGNYDTEDLKRFVEENMHVQRYEGGKSKRFRFPIIANNNTDNTQDGDKPGTTWVYGNGRPYVFHARDFLSTQEFKDLFPEAQDAETSEKDTDQQLPF